MDESLIIKIKKDLTSTGFGSELKAFNEFASSGWAIQSGQYFFDKDENKTREIDLIGHISEGVFQEEKICIRSYFNICAEIKKSSNPWAVIKNPLPKHGGCAWNNIIHYCNLPTAPYNLTPFFKSYSLYYINGWIGTGIHQAFSKPDSPSKWFSAFTSVCKATENEFEKNTFEYPKETNDILKNPTNLSFYQPLVIFDGDLVTAELSFDGEILINEIDSAAFRFEFKTQNYKRRAYRVDLIRLSFLKKYLELCKNRQSEIVKGLIHNCKIINHEKILIKT